MSLTPTEEKLFREKIRKDLEEREIRILEGRKSEEILRQERLEFRIRNQIKEEEEKRYFTQKGYVEYRNRYGEVEWITSEEAEKRKRKRRSKKGSSSSRRKGREKRKYLQWSVNVGMILSGILFFFVLLKWNPFGSTVNNGRIFIKTDVPGARIYINGSGKNMFTPDSLFDVPGGNYFVSVYKEGYSTWPPMQKVNVNSNQTVITEFQLKNTALLGKIQVDANIEDYRIYVDGIYYPLTNKIMEIPAGYHVVSVVKKGFLASPAYQRVIVKENGISQLKFRFQKSDKVGYLKISSNRSSAYIYLDERLTGIKANNEAIPVESGLYEVRLRENGFQCSPAEKLLNILPGETHAVNFNMQAESQLDTLTIITSNPGVGITVDGQWMPYVTPVAGLRLSEGGHFINLVRDGNIYAKNDIYMTFDELKMKKVMWDF